MNCPFCGKNLIEGDLRCPHCRAPAIDFDYLENMNRMEEKYSKYSLLDLSREKLTFEEIVTVYTFIERQTIMAVTARFLMSAGWMEHSPIYPKD